MKRSEINSAWEKAQACFEAGGWVLPPNPQCDVTDFGLGDFGRFGLVLVNLADEVEYCEKIMYAARGQVTPLHTHRLKKEDIICRRGELAIELWAGDPEHTDRGTPFQLKRSGDWVTVASGDTLELQAGERVTLTPGMYHAFWPLTDGCMIGEVSTSNDDVNDNVFVNPDIGRFPEIEEDEPARVRLLSDKT